MTLLSRLFGKSKSASGRVDMFREISRLQGHTGRVTCVDVNTDGRYAVTGADDGSARFWAIAKAEQLKMHSSLGRVASVAFIPGATRCVLLTAAPNPTRNWDWVWTWSPEDEPKAVPLDIQCPWSFCGDIAFSPDGSNFALAGGTALIRVVETKSGRELCQLAANAPPEAWVHYTSAAYSPCGKYLLATPQALDAVAVVWQIEDQKVVATLKNPPGSRLQNDANSAAWSSDGKTIFTGHEDGSILRWQFGQAEAPTQLCRMRFVITRIELMPQDKIGAAVGTDFPVAVTQWETSTGVVTRRRVVESDEGGPADQTVRAIEAYRKQQSVWDIAHNQATGVFALACADGTVRIVDADLRGPGTALKC